MGQHFLVKSVLKPSGPGALSEGNDLTTKSICCLSKGATKELRSVVCTAHAPRLEANGIAARPHLVLHAARTLQAVSTCHLFALAPGVRRWPLASDWIPTMRPHPTRRGHSCHPWPECKLFELVPPHLPPWAGPACLADLGRHRCHRRYLRLRNSNHRVSFVLGWIRPSRLRKPIR